MAAPVPEQGRVGLIDALRGAALFGVLLVNMLWFAGFDNALNPAQSAALTARPLDATVEAAIEMLVYAKSIGIFTFLFGVGFWLQMQSLRARDPAGATRIYLRRLCGLLVLGMAHWLLWSGDILHVYALGGLALFLLRRWRTRTLVIAGLAAGVLARPVVGRVIALLTTGSVAADGPGEAQLPQRFGVFMHGSPWDVITLQFWQDLLPHIITLAWIAAVLHALGRFMLGLAVARGNLLQDARAHWRALALTCVAGAAVGFVAQRDWVVRDLLSSHGLVADRGWLALLGHLSSSIGVTALTAAYVAAFALAWQLPLLQKPLAVLAPLGRMALTNYLSYTPLCYLLFCGFGLGLMGRAGPAACLALSVLIFAAQILGSRLWLARFRMGPAEWLWRWWTYGARSPLHRA